MASITSVIFGNLTHVLPLPVSQANLTNS